MCQVEVVFRSRPLGDTGKATGECFKVGQLTLELAYADQVLASRFLKSVGQVVHLADGADKQFCLGGKPFPEQQGGCGMMIAFKICGRKVGLA